jgi:hypothetical protein
MREEECLDKVEIKYHSPNIDFMIESVYFLETTYIIFRFSSTRALEMYSLTSSDDKLQETLCDMQ